METPRAGPKGVGHRTEKGVWWMDGAGGKKSSAAPAILRSGRELDPRRSELWEFLLFFPFIFLPFSPTILPPSLSSSFLLCFLLPPFLSPSHPSYTFTEHLLSANHYFRLWQSLVDKICIVLTLGKLRASQGRQTVNK